MTVRVILSAFGAAGMVNRLSQQGESYRPPSLDYLLGTDAAGRSVLPMLIHATFGTVVEVLAASLVALCVGVTVGFIGAATRTSFARFLAQSATLLAYSTPLLVVTLLLYALFGDNGAIFSVAAGGLLWGGIALAAHTSVQIELPREYLVAARAIGVTPVRLVWNHLLPNVLPVIRAAWLGTLAPLLNVSLIISFLGAQAGRPRLGSLIKSGYEVFPACPWLWIPPTFLCFTLLMLTGILTRKKHL